jgi:hypothetical protein
MFLDRASWNGATLHYVGPVFSTQRAYLPLFAWWVGGLAEQGRPFAVVAEVESALVQRDIQSLLPGWIYPRAEERCVRAELGALAVAAQASFPHVQNVDLATLTTPVVEPVGRHRRHSSSRYQLLFLPCFGQWFDADRLRKDLARGSADSRTSAA